MDEIFSVIAPHKASTTVEIVEEMKPYAALTPEVYARTNAYINQCGSDEFGWVGKVAVRKVGDNPLYVVTEIVPVPQVADGGVAILDKDAIGQLVDEAIAASRTGENPYRFYGHVHVGSSPTPSAKDDTQMRKFIDGRFTPPYMLRGIFAKQPDYQMGCRKAHFTLFDGVRGAWYKDLQWTIVDDAGNEAAKEVIDRLRTKSPVVHVMDEETGFVGYSTHANIRHLATVLPSHNRDGKSQESTTKSDQELVTFSDVLGVARKWWSGGNKK